MSIQKELRRARSILIQKDLVAFGWLIGIFIFLGLTLAIYLESFFYFSKEIKMISAWVSLGIVSLLIFLGAIYYFLIQNNKIYRYSWSHLAQLLGNKGIQEKPDRILNALQLSEEENQSDLADEYISSITRLLKKLDYSILLIHGKLPILKQWTAGATILFFALFLVRADENIPAIYRLAHPNITYNIPKPFQLVNMTGDVHLLGGESSEFIIRSEGSNPDTVYAILTPSQFNLDSTNNQFLSLKSERHDDGLYHFEIENVFQDYTYQGFVPAEHFWEVWEEVATDTHQIYVTDRPTFESFTITVIPPKYSGLQSETQEGNVANIQGLKGSVIQVNLKSNRHLKESYIVLNDSKKGMKIYGKKATGQFELTSDGQFTVHLLDSRNIANREPVPYHLQVLPDHLPVLDVLSPPPMVELGNSMSIPFHLKIEDDYGFSQLQVGYEIKRPAFLEMDPYVSIFTIPGLKMDTVSQEIIMNWDLSDFSLLPDDEVHYHFELYDNDNISGPKKSISGTFIARLPSLADLYESMEEQQSMAMDDAEVNLDALDELREQLDNLELEALKTDAMNWEQQKEIKELLEKASEELKALEKLTEAMESINSQSEKHQLFSDDLMEKFKELQELVESLIPEDLLKNMNDLQDALDEMNMEKLKDAMENLSNNMEQLESDLDRYLDIFKRLQAEQKMDEITKRLEQLTEQQDVLDRDLNKSPENADPSTFARMEQDEQRNLQEFQSIESLMEDASEIISPYSESASESLEKMESSDLTESTENALSQSMKHIGKMQKSDAQQQSMKALQNLQKMQEQFSQIQNQFRMESVAQMTEKFQAMMQDVLYLSKKQENLTQEVKDISRTSHRLRELTAQQQLLQDQLRQIMNQMMELSRETFSITPQLGQSMGMTAAMMEQAKSELADRNTTKANTSQSKAMQSLNEAALSLFNSMKQMETSGSASGYEAFLKQLQEMSGKQQGLNNQGMQLSLSQMAASAQQKMMRQMLKGQKQVKKSLGQLMEEMQQSGEQGLGDLSGIGKDMEEVIKDLQRKRFTRQTQNRQQRILSRMLDSQKSMTQRGQKEERKSEVADFNILFEGPAGLPGDLGQRKSLALDALNRSLGSGYPKEYQNMIKKYFNTISESKVLYEKESKND